MTATELKEEIISRMLTILGPPQPREGVMVLLEEWAGDWKLWMYCYYSRNDYSITAYNHELSVRGLCCNNMNTEGKIEYDARVCVESLLPALRKATVLIDLASIAE
jgi:hypothetical protein